MAPLNPLLRINPPKRWTPGPVKLTGPMRINWHHPLAYGLLCYWFDTGAGAVIDLVTGRIMTKPSSMVAPANGSTPYGDSYKYITSNIVQLADPIVAGNQALATPYSIAAGIFPLGASTATGIYFGMADVSGNDCVSIYGPSTTTLGVSYGNTSSAFSFTYTANTFYVVVGSATGASAQSSWVNGIAQTAGTATSLFSGSGQHYLIGAGGFNALTGTPNANVFFGATWQGRALTQADAILLYTDPYCFLVPLEPEMMAFQLPVADILYSQSIF